MTCEHSQLTLDESTFASEARFQYLPWASRHSATTRYSKAPPPPPLLKQPPFPAPLVLPGDDLALDPKYPPQSVDSFSLVRNLVTPARRIIYVVDYPSSEKSVDFVSKWSWPMQHHAPTATSWRPSASDIVDYLTAFYHDMPVKLLPSDTLKFSPWSNNRSTLANLKSGKSKRQAKIGVQAKSQILGIESRPAPDGVFARQLNLCHLLDVAIEILPDDAFALLLLVHQDLHEGIDDDFCCGRAFGGSRVAIVSTARYNPILDKEQNLDLDHTWPHSHCVDYVQSMTGLEQKIKPRHGYEQYDPSSSILPLKMASDAVKAFRSQRSESDLSTWLSRVCRTASHELGHCVGMDHCVYYACAMQGTASLAEDIRQPPYLCPVDDVKMNMALDTDERSRLKAMMDFCERHLDVELFVGYGAWLKGRLQQIDAELDQLAQRRKPQS